MRTARPSFIARNIIGVAGPDGSINWNRIDDLIVRLYWSAYTGAIPPHWTRSDGMMPAPAK